MERWCAIKALKSWVPLLEQIAPAYRVDLVLWTGDPLELTSWARWTMIEGQPFAPASRQLQLRDRYRNPAQRVLPPGG